MWGEIQDIWPCLFSYGAAYFLFIGEPCWLMRIVFGEIWPCRFSYGAAYFPFEGEPCPSLLSAHAGIYICLFLFGSLTACQNLRKECKKLKNRPSAASATIRSLSLGHLRSLSLGPPQPQPPLTPIALRRALCISILRELPGQRGGAFLARRRQRDP